MKEQKSKESSESTNMPKSLTPLDTFDQPLSHCIKYANIQDFWKKNNLPSRKTKFAGSYWRLGDMSIGHSRGLHNLRGIAVATDGCVLIVETEDGKLVDTHLDNWVKDKAQPAVRGSANGNHSSSATSIQQQLATERLAATLASLLA